MVDARPNAKARKREVRLVTARTASGVYVDLFVYVHETTYGDDEWIETGRAYRLRDGTEVHATAAGELHIASTGEVLFRK